jgi:hypothetical protein
MFFLLLSIDFFYFSIQFYDCRNHVRVIQPMGDGSRLYVCGTNAHNPKDWVINVSTQNIHFNFLSLTPKMSHTYKRERKKTTDKKERTKFELMFVTSSGGSRMEEDSFRTAGKSFAEVIAIDEGKWEEFVTDNDLLTIKKKEDRKEGARLELELFWQTFLLSVCRPDV